MITPHGSGVVALGVACVFGAALTACSDDGSRPVKPSGRAGALTHAPAATRLRGVIAFSTAGGDIWVMRANGTQRRRLTRSGPAVDFDPSLSPDGRRVVFRSTRGPALDDPEHIGVNRIIEVSVRGGRLEDLTPPRGGLFPAFSPDGRVIAVSSIPSDRSESLFVMRPDGSGLRDLRPRYFGEVATWSPDGGLLAYAAHPPGRQFDVWIMHRDGSSQRRLTSGPGDEYPAAFSPDGRRILFTAGIGEERAIWSMPVDGAGTRRVGTGRRSAEGWLPDGRILFSVSHGDTPRASWYLMRPDGTHVERLPQLAQASPPLDWLWRPRG